MTARVHGPHPGAFFAASLWFAALLGGCVSTGAGSYADPDADFGAFRTFSWIDADAYVDSEASRPVSALARSMIETGIRRQLEAKRYTFTEDRSRADILVAYTVGTRQNMRMDAYPIDYRGHWGWHEPYEHYFFRDVSLKNYTEGTLGVDLFENETGKPVWHGWAQGAVPPSGRDDPASRIAEGITRLFASFPE